MRACTPLQFLGKLVRFRVSQVYLEKVLFSIFFLHDTSVYLPRRRSPNEAGAFGFQAFQKRQLWK